MSQDIPNDDFETKTSETLSTYASNTSGWDIGEYLLIIGLAVSGAGVIMGDFSLIPIFGLLIAVWFAVSKVADTRIDQRVDLSKTGKEKEVKWEKSYHGDCDMADEDGIPCGGNYHTARTYDVFRIGGHEICRSLKTKNRYCSHHHAMEYPSESDVDLDEILDEVEEEEQLLSLEESSAHD